MITWSVVTGVPRKWKGLSCSEARPGADVMVWVPKIRSARGGSATDSPMVVTSLIRVDWPRMCRKSTA